jgi:hypothetical protein
MSSSKNALNTILKKMGRPDKMTVLTVLIVVMTLICVSRVML